MGDENAHLESKLVFYVDDNCITICMLNKKYLLGSETVYIYIIFCHVQLIGFHKQHVGQEQ